MKRKKSNQQSFFFFFGSAESFKEKILAKAVQDTINQGILPLLSAKGESLRRSAKP